MTDISFHYAWGGRLCLHPFNLGFRRALSHANEIPNLKYPPVRCTGTEALVQNRNLNGSGDMGGGPTSPPPDKTA